MHLANQVHLRDVQSVYSGAEGRLWELLMGQQIHIGGLQSSLDLAQTAQISEGWRGVDLCCATGAGMRVLLRFCKAAHMTGVDATPTMLDLARQRAAEEGFAGQTTWVEGNVCASGLAARAFDFAWGEDAWCYVEDKARLIAEAVRIVKRGGIVAFTDWMEGPLPMTDVEAARYLSFMKFPSILLLEEYRALLEGQGCVIRAARNTGRFPDHASLYLDMVEKQLTYDALKLISFNEAMAATIISEMRFLQSLAQAGKIIQGLIVAQKRS